MLDGYATIFKGIGTGFLKVFSISTYIDIFKEHSVNFNAGTWILAILAVILVIGLHVLIVFLIIMGIRKYIRFRHSIVSNEDLLEEITVLQKRVMKMAKEKVQQSKNDFLKKTPDYEQVSYRLKVTKMDASHVRCDFQKRTVSQGKTRVYPSYLIYVTDDNGTSWQIDRESDLVTDRNLEKKKTKSN